jgi:hypothetical protein
MAATAFVVPGPNTIPAGTTLMKNATIGVDISWPECAGNPMPTTDVGFVIVGLTNGHGFDVNSCLDVELAFVHTWHLPLAVYAMSTYPTSAQLATYGGSGPGDPSTLRGRLVNAGAAQARYNIRTMALRGIRATTVWIDIEDNYRYPWSTDLGRNRAVIEGMIAGYQASHYAVGFYSTRYMWGRIVGSYGPQGYP